MYIIHLGFSAFPTGFAATQRVRFTFKAVKQAGYTPLIINKQSTHTKVPYTKHINRYDGLLFTDTSPIITIPQGFVKRNANKIAGLVNEFRLLCSKRKKIKAAILYTSNFRELIYYRIISKLFSFKLTIQYVEYRSVIAERSSFSKRLNDKLFDKYCQNFCDGIIVISEYLKSAIHKKKPALPLIKIPAICNFYEFEKVPSATTGYKYMLYCGTINYLPVIDFVLSFFEKLKDQELYRGKIVFIISGGNNKNYVTVGDMFKKNKYHSDIVLYKNIPYNDVISLFKAADLLIIPLRKTLQDIARFPQKISEYTAAGRPFISSKVGELNYYFKDQETALLAEDYDVDLYVETFKQMKEHNVALESIAQKAHEIGRKNFHYESNIENIKQFFNSL